MQIGVLLSGNGVFDGSEIHEAVLTLLALDQLQAQAVCMAPDMPQHHVINHITGAEVGAERKVEIGRTSDRLRNPGNAPPAWARSAVERLAGRPAAEVGPLAVDLGDRVGVLLPIAVKSACLGCHGPAAGLSPKVKEALAAAYPADRATGYAEGDARGFTWVVTAR